MEITLGIEGGLSSDSDHFTCPKDKLLLLADAYFNAGSLKGRWPKVKINSVTLTSTAQVDHVVGWQDPAQIGTSTRYCLIAVSNNKVFRTNWNGDSAQPSQTFTDITNSVSVGTFPCTSDSLNGRLVICTNNQPPVTISTYNGNISALAGSPPTGVCVKTVNNFMFISGTYFGGTTGIFSRVYWSNASDPTTWPAASNLDFRLNDGDFVTALGSIGTNLYIFKQNSIGCLSTTTISVSGTVTLGPLSTVAVGIGCSSPCGVDNLPDGRIVFYGTDNNVYIFDGSTFTNISLQQYPGASIRAAISTAYGTVPSLSSASPTVKVYPSTHEVWVIPYTITSGGAASTAFIYDYQNNFWSSSTQYKIQSLGLLGPSRNQPDIGYPSRLVYGGIGTDAGFIFFPENINDTGTTSTSTQILEWTIPLVAGLTSFIPTSVVIPATLVNTSVIVQFGFDGNIQATTYTLSTSIFRHVLPIKYPYGSNSTRFCTFQLKISNFGSNDKFYPITLSDEVLN